MTGPHDLYAHFIPLWIAKSWLGHEFRLENSCDDSSRPLKGKQWLLISCSEIANAYDVRIVQALMFTHK